MTLGEENTSHQDYAVSSAGCNTTSLKVSSKRHTRRIPVVNGQGHAGLVSQGPACKGLVPGGSAGVLGMVTRWSLGRQSSKRTAELTSSSLLPD